MLDQTLLRPEAGEREVRSFVEAACGAGFGAVFVSPRWVPLARAVVDGSGAPGRLRLGTTAAFPLGTATVDAKCYEAVDAVERGADEVDFVIAIPLLKDGRDDELVEEMRAVADSAREAGRAAGRTIGVKAIVEACYLTDDEKRRAVECAVAAGLDFVKTSTGFGPGGATVEDVRLLAEAAAGRVRVKASGGIRTLEQALAMLAAGADRVGTSAGLAILAEFGR